MRSVRRCLALSLLLAPACQQSGSVARDAAGDGAADAPTFDAPPAADGIVPQSLDFTATGCDSFDLGAARCTGAAPLTVTFSPIASPSLTQFLWDFGDGTPRSKQRAPVHSYTYPGSFSVALVGAGQSGSLSRMRARFIVVPQTAPGQPCDVDAQCAGGQCVCGTADRCGGAFTRGVCAADCAADPCAAGTVCADLSAGAPAAPAIAAPYQRALCLGACTDDKGCAAGQRCRLLPTSGGGAIHAWVRACFAPVPADVGDPCRAPDGTLPGQTCSSGVCAALGALGVCSATCDATGGCPSGAACARFGDGRSLCLRTCAGSGDCAADPLLACETAGAAGALGFNVITPGAPGAACAPRSCQAAADCQPAGTCSDGHCQPR